MNSLDTYLKEASAKTRWMIYISFVLVVFIVLNQTLPPLLDKNKELQDDVASLQRNLLQNPARNLKQQLQENRELLLKEKTLLEEKKELLSHVMSGLYGIDYAVFDESSWTKVLDSIIKQSKREDLKIKSLKNIIAQDKSNLLVKHKRTLSIEGSGGFSNLLAFIQYIENQDILLDYKSIQMENSQDGVDFALNVELYGVGL